MTQKANDDENSKTLPSGTGGVYFARGILDKGPIEYTMYLEGLQLCLLRQICRDITLDGLYRARTQLDKMISLQEREMSQSPESYRLPTTNTK